MIVVGALAAAGALILGFITFAVIAGVILVLACVVAVRLWWFKRSFMQGQPTQEQTQTSHTSSSANVIEGEYQEVDERRDSID